MQQIKQLNVALSLFIVDHYAKLRAARYCHSVGASKRRRILQRISISLHSENAKMLQCGARCRTHPSFMLLSQVV